PQLRAGLSARLPREPLPPRLGRQRPAPRDAPRGPTAAHGERAGRLRPPSLEDGDPSLVPGLLRQLAHRGPHARGAHLPTAGARHAPAAALPPLPTDPLLLLRV